MPDDFFAEALSLHKRFGGKLEIQSKVPLTDRADLSRAYTPGVGQVCVEIGKDAQKAYEYTLKKNTVAIVSDGSAILGLGNLGAAAAIPVMEGKAILMKQFAGVDAFPICLATQDTEEIIKAVKQIAPVFGAINLEDISAPRCFEIERRLRAELDIPVMHDDQHGTAVVVLAGLINALAVRGSRPDAVRVIFSGAGAAGTAVAELMLAHGFTDITMVDSQGALYGGRSDLNPEKRALAARTNPRGVQGSLREVLRGADVFVGLSKARVVDEAMVRSMAERPIVFALANPIPEILPDAAHKAGAFIVATGRSDFPNQVNNVLGFPGIFKGALASRKQFTDALFLRAAHSLAACVPAPTADHILPDPFDKKVVAAVSAAIAAH